MAFHAVRFPTNIGRGLVAGPGRRVQIRRLGSGNEGRAPTWLVSRRRYDVAYGIRTIVDLAAVVAFFEARGGPLFGFLFKDWADYVSGQPGSTPAATDQVIGTGDGATFAFQLVKRYGPGAGYDRTIGKPVAGSVLVALDGVPQASGWSVDPSTGVVVFDVAPAVGVQVTAGFEFDVPVRFENQVLEVTLDRERSGEAAVPLVEIILGGA